MGKRRVPRRTQPTQRDFAQRELARAAAEQILTSDQGKVIDDAYRLDVSDGWKQALGDAGKTTYAASILALRAEFGFGQERCRRFIERMDQEVTNTLDSREALDKVFEDIGLKINFDDPLEHVEVLKRG